MGLVVTPEGLVGHFCRDRKFLSCVDCHFLLMGNMKEVPLAIGIPELTPLLNQ
jgi:hypothetical protein